MEPSIYPRPIKLENIMPAGELRNRALMSLNRLEKPDYHFDFALKQTPQAPGDYLGRILLARTLLWRTLKEKPGHLDELARRLPEALNPEGYAGEVMDEPIKELVIAGHNAMLRGLCEYYTLTGDEEIFDMIGSVIDKLIVPFCGRIHTYPDIDPARMAEGEQVALVWGEMDGWELSTDIGTVYLTLDGMTHAYQVRPSSRLRDVIEKMIRQYAATDLIKINAQTHSSLSAVRGILRFFESTGCDNTGYLELAEKTFRLYMDCAATENYANYNWFERPEWTEPCAVVDSFTIAVWLWRLTGKADYLRAAHLILYNALLPGQRPSGGFGCDNCLGTKNQVSLNVVMYEAGCCCNMRGAEGLARMIESEYFTVGEKLIIPFMADSTATLTFPDGEVIVRQTSGYPYEGETRLKILFSATNGEKEISIFLPDWISRDGITLKASSGELPFIIEGEFLTARTAFAVGEVIVLRFAMPLRREGLHNERAISGYHRYFHGPLLLGREGAGEETIRGGAFEHMGGGVYQEKRSGMMLKPICVRLKPGDEPVPEIQALFPNGSCME